jgi:exosortase/archaeosortase family protein
VNLFSFFPSQWAKLPTQVRQFLLKCAFLLLIFETYNLGFESQYKWLNIPLTNSVADYTIKVLNFLNMSSEYTRRELISTDINEGIISYTHANLILRQSRKALFIADSCNGLEMQALYLGFILAIPGQWKRKLLFAAIGPFLIFYVNVLRCAGLVELRLFYPFHFDFAHHYLFKIIVYSFIFFLWYLFVQNLNPVARIEKK